MAGPILLAKPSRARRQDKVQGDVQDNLDAAVPESRRERGGVVGRFLLWALEYFVDCLRQSSIHGMIHISTPSRRHPAER